MKDIDASIEWYEKSRPLYESLARKVEDIIKENLEQRNIQYHSVASRGKSLDSFANKSISAAARLPAPMALITVAAPVAFLGFDVFA